MWTNHFQSNRLKSLPIALYFSKPEFSNPHRSTQWIRRIILHSNVIVSIHRIIFKIFTLWTTLNSIPYMGLWPRLAPTARSVTGTKTHVPNSNPRSRWAIRSQPVASMLVVKSSPTPRATIGLRVTNTSSHKKRTASTYIRALKIWNPDNRFSITNHPNHFSIVD